jgi:hypothetical protein
MGVLKMGISSSISWGEPSRGVKRYLSRKPGEFPDEKVAASAILAAAAGGSLSDIETTVAMSAKDAAATCTGWPAGQR